MMIPFQSEWQPPAPGLPNGVTAQSGPKPDQVAAAWIWGIRRGRYSGLMVNRKLIGCRRPLFMEPRDHGRRRVAPGHKLCAPPAVKLRGTGGAIPAVGPPETCIVCIAVLSPQIAMSGKKPVRKMATQSITVLKTVGSGGSNRNHTPI